MTVKVYSTVDPDVLGVEIGQATKIRFRWNGQGIPLGNGIYELTGSHITGGLDLYNWKTPVEPQVSQLRFGNNNTAEVRNRDMIIAALVNMLGGAVTLQPHELDGARSLDLQAIQQMDPHMLILKTAKDTP